jgi:hypothetical protein
MTTDAERPASDTVDRCPDCGTPKAHSVCDAAKGYCPKWWAIRDPDAELDCFSVADIANPPVYVLEEPI